MAGFFYAKAQLQNKNLVGFEPRIEVCCLVNLIDCKTI